MSEFSLPKNGINTRWLSTRATGSLNLIFAKLRYFVPLLKTFALKFLKLIFIHLFLLANVVEEKLLENCL